jgi:hypothetical protein
VWLATLDPSAFFAMPEYVRSIVQRRLRRRLGMIEAASLAAVADWTRRITGLWATTRPDHAVRVAQRSAAADPTA